MTGQNKLSPNNNNSFALAQTSSDVLAGYRAIESALPTNARFECERNLAQAFCVLSIHFNLFLKSALLSGYTLLVIRYKCGCCSSSQTARQQQITGIDIGYIF